MPEAAAGRMAGAIKMASWTASRSPRLRLARRCRRLGSERGGTDLRRAAGHVRHRQGFGICDGKASTALKSVKERLATEHGIMLVQPPFSRYHLELGEITSYPPGYKENGGIFCQVNPWIMIAETILGDGEAAFEYYADQPLGTRSDQ